MPRRKKVSIAVLPTNEESERNQVITRLTEKRDEYVERLDVGAAKIEEARSQGKDVTLWEDYWIQLLRQYEAVCDKLREYTTSGGVVTHSSDGSHGTV